MSISLLLKLYLPFIGRDGGSGSANLAFLLSCDGLEEAFLSLSETVSLLEKHLAAVDGVLKDSIVQVLYLRLFHPVD